DAGPAGESLAGMPCKLAIAMLVGASVYRAPLVTADTVPRPHVSLAHVVVAHPAPAKPRAAPPPAVRVAKPPPKLDAATVVLQYQRVGHELAALEAARGAPHITELRAAFDDIELGDALATAEGRASADAAIRDLRDRI